VSPPWNSTRRGGWDEPYRLPAFYELHVWAWKDNRSGTFADWNPAVACDECTGEDRTLRSDGWAATNTTLTPAPATRIRGRCPLHAHAQWRRAHSGHSPPSWGASRRRAANVWSSW
jgi:hypothetical protein